MSRSSGKSSLEIISRCFLQSLIQRPWGLLQTGKVISSPWFLHAYRISVRTTTVAKSQPKPIFNLRSGSLLISARVNSRKLRFRPWISFASPSILSNYNFISNGIVRSAPILSTHYQVIDWWKVYPSQWSSHTYIVLLAKWAQTTSIPGPPPGPLRFSSSSTSSPYSPATGFRSDNNCSAVVLALFLSKLKSSYLVVLDKKPNNWFELHQSSITYRFRFDSFYSHPPSLRVVAHLRFYSRQRLMPQRLTSARDRAVLRWRKRAEKLWMAHGPQTFTALQDVAVKVRQLFFAEQRLCFSKIFRAIMTRSVLLASGVSNPNQHRILNTSYHYHLPLSCVKTVQLIRFSLVGTLFYVFLSANPEMFWFLRPSLRLNVIVITTVIETLNSNVKLWHWHSGSKCFREARLDSHFAGAFDPDDLPGESDSENPDLDQLSDLGATTITVTDVNTVIAIQNVFHHKLRQLCFWLPARHSPLLFPPQAPQPVMVALWPPMRHQITARSHPRYPQHRETYLATRLIEMFLNDMYVILDISLGFLWLGLSAVGCANWYVEDTRRLILRPNEPHCAGTLESFVCLWLGYFQTYLW